jgi:hypothetical protein
MPSTKYCVYNVGIKTPARCVKGEAPFSWRRSDRVQKVAAHIAKSLMATPDGHEHVLAPRLSTKFNEATFNPHSLYASLKSI